MTQIVWGQGEDGDMFSFENFGKHVQVICTSNMKIFFGKYSLKDRGYFNYYFGWLWKVNRKLSTWTRSALSKLKTTAHTKLPGGLFLLFKL